MYLLYLIFRLANLFESHQKQVMSHLDKKYWNDRYAQQLTGWDVGEVTTPLKEYFDQLKDKRLRILIPGAGNAYEAEYLSFLGFDQVYVLDISDRALDSFKSRVKVFPGDHVQQGDFFKHSGQYDLIIEQTFFCALDVSLRPSYFTKCCDLLGDGGKLVGLWWNHEFEGSEPPFGGSAEEYQEQLKPHFKVDTLELCYNSIKPRMGRELFLKLVKHD